MFFILSKTAGFFASASNTLIVLALIGVALLATRFSGAGLRLLVTAVVLLAIVGYSPLGNILMQALEDRFPRWDDSRGAPDGIIVLGGAVGPRLSAVRGTPALDEAAERLTVMGELARRFPQARVVYTGGSSALFEAEGSEAEVALPLLASFGIARDRLIAETKSRNTVENALFTKALVEPKPNERWLLVTSGYHMPRSVGIFRKAGFPVEAYPVDWRTRGPADRLRPFATLGDGLRRTDTALREWVGLLAYWATGKTDALFPAP